MWGIISTTFLLTYGLMSYYIGRRGWTTLGKSLSPVFQKIYWCFVGLVVLSFPISEMGEDLLPPSGGVWLTILGGYSMVAVVYLFLLILFIDLFRLSDNFIGLIPATLKDSQKTPRILGASVIIIVIVTLVYGTWNARNPIVTNYDLNIDKTAGSLPELRIALVSDIHYGSIINAPRVNKMVKIINQLKPDVILFAGDITEGSTTQAEIRELAGILKQMQAKYGKIAVLGNHDRPLKNDSGSQAYFKAAGITVLRDNSIKLGNSFYVIGRDDPGHRNQSRRKDMSSLLTGIDASYPLILLDHQPIDLKESQESKIDLQLSGHTHRGQIFPSQLITGQIFEIDWGLLKKDNFHLVVSSGYGTWGPTMRIGNHPEVVNINIKFRKADSTL